MKNLLLCLIGIILSSCAGSTSRQAESPADIISQATGISIIKHKGFTTVEVKNPWKEGAVLQTYILVPSNDEIPADLPKGTLVRTPVIKALVYSSVHGGIIKELGEINAIAGVCDAQYFNMPEIQQGLKAGKVTDAGASMTPSNEKIIALQPDVIILSPFQNAGYGVLSSLGIPIIESADYMETTPLGRAEWIKFYGALFCKEQLADSIYNAVVSRYNQLKKSVASIGKRPKVISESSINGTWYVPGGNSYMTHFFMDAGAAYPWSDDKSTGSISLDMARVLDKAHDADIWLIKTFDPDFSYVKLGAQNALNTQFEAFKQKHIYFCDTGSTSFFEDFPFHPDVLLQEYIAIFHPEKANGYRPKYFKPLHDD